MPRRPKSVFRAPKTSGVGPTSHQGSVGKATQVWRNPRKPRTQKGWKPYGS